MDSQEKDHLTELFSLVFQEMQEFRRNNTRLFFGVMGLILALIGWTISKDAPLTNVQKILLSGGIFIVSGSYIYLSNTIRNYFLQAATVVCKIDKIYGFYESGKYIKDDTILPAEWESFGTKKWKEPMFIATKIGVILISIFGTIVLWLY